MTITTDKNRFYALAVAAEAMLYEDGVRFVVVLELNH